MTGPSGLAFTKLEALGNDFVLIDGRQVPVELDADQVRRLAHRRTGIGFDQLLLLAQSDSALSLRIVNADGSRAEQCGNGLRAIAAWLGLGPTDRVRVESPAGTAWLSGHADGGFVADLPGPSRADLAALGLPDPTLPSGIDRWTLVTLGNPHLVLFDERPPTAERLREAVETIGQRREWNNAVNIGLCHAGAGGIALRVHERGAGPTAACGSGACAAAWALGANDGAFGTVPVEQPGGTLVVDLATPGRAVTTGPARVVFEGRIA